MATATETTRPRSSSQSPGSGSHQHQSGQGSQQDHSEGMVARAIEEQTAKLPSDLFLWAAGASVAGSLFLQFNGRQHESLFVGQWAPTFLILGLYNKLVKIAGSDQTSNGASQRSGSAHGAMGL